MTTMFRRRRRLLAGSAAVAAVAVGLVAGALQFSSAASAQEVSCNTPVTSAPTERATVSAHMTDYGTVLVLGGSGAKADCSLYVLTSDPRHAHPGTDYACPDTPVPQLENPTCANDLWPALLTKGAPIAGPGVDKHLLKTVARTDVIPGQVVQQVTYAGRPLYFFFEDENPGETDGANLFDNVVSPTGVWYLVDPSTGLPAPGTAHLQPEDSSSNFNTGPDETVLSVVMNNSWVSGFQNAQFPVYTFSGDSGGTSTCTGQCAANWPPVLTSGPPTGYAGLGEIMRPDGSYQVTYNGQPLYLYVGDAYIYGLPSPFDGPGKVQGDGVSAFGGTFNAIPLS